MSNLNFSDLDSPLYCTNHLCGCWSHPAYCFEAFVRGFDVKPVCKEFIEYSKVKLLPYPKVIQLSLFDYGN